MLPPVLHTNRGFTLVEFLVALVIVMVGLLGLLASLDLGIRQNVGNKLRNDAITLADQVMATQRVRPFDNISVTHACQKASASFVNYSVVKDVSVLSSTSKSVVVTISWRELAEKKTHSLSTVIINESVK